MASTKRRVFLMSRAARTRFVPQLRQRLIRGYLFVVCAAITLLSAAPLRAQAGDINEPGVHDLVNLDTLAPWQQSVVEFFRLTLFGVALWRVLLAVGVLSLGFALRTAILKRLFRPLQALVKRSDSDVDDLLLETLHRPFGWVIRLLAFYLALVILEPPASLMRVATLGMQTVGTILVAWVIFHLVDVFAMAMTRSRDDGSDASLDRELVPLVMNVVRAVLFVIVAIALIQQWGYDVTSLVAGLGIGGLAFALAAKPTLANWFGSVMIFTDRPFKIGDWVKTAVGEGVVEDIGLRSTKIRTFAETLISVPNSDVAALAIENCSAMPKRRLLTSIGIAYGTTGAQMEQIIAGIKERLQADERIEDGTWRVYFDSFGSSSLEILLQCWMISPGYENYLGVDLAGIRELSGCQRGALSGYDEDRRAGWQHLRLADPFDSDGRAATRAQTIRR